MNHQVRSGHGHIAFGGETYEVSAVHDAAPGQECLDGFVVVDGLAVVADGVSPLEQAESPRVVRFVEALTQALCDERNAPGSEIFRRASLASRQRSASHERPAAAVALARDNGPWVELFAVADCLAVAISSRNEGRWVLDDRVHPFEVSVARAHEAALNDGGSSEDAGRAAQSARAKIRALRNQPGGYWVVDGNPAVAYQVESARIEAADVRAVLVCSDGFTRLWKTYKLVDGPIGLTRWACDDGLSDLLALLRKQESTSEEAPHLHVAEKAHDDATAVLLKRL